MKCLIKLNSLHYTIKNKTKIKLSRITIFPVMIYFIAIKTYNSSIVYKSIQLSKKWITNKSEKVCDEFLSLSLISINFNFIHNIDLILWKYKTIFKRVQNNDLAVYWILNRIDFVHVRSCMFIHVFKIQTIISHVLYISSLIS